MPIHFRILSYITMAAATAYASSWRYVPEDAVSAHVPAPKRFNVPEDAEPLPVARPLHSPSGDVGMHSKLEFMKMMLLESLEEKTQRLQGEVEAAARLANNDHVFAKEYSLFDQTKPMIDWIKGKVGRRDDAVAPAARRLHAEASEKLAQHLEKIELLKTL